MRALWLSFLLVMPACATRSHFVATANDTVVSIDDVADDLAKADVVALGELHRTPPVHAAHHALLRELHERRGDLVIAMEMFERDTQTALMTYLAGMCDEGTFLAASRPWPDYARDYRPVIEFAKQNGLMVLAPNAPRPLAAKVGKQGIAAVAGERDVARETTAPEDEYWEAFLEAMKGHPGTTPEMLANMYAAQCLKDDTMAESITDYLAKHPGRKPLVVLICGNMHSNYGRGTVARIKRRMPNLDVRVVSAETVADLEAGIFKSPRSIGDYVVVAQEPARPSPAPKDEATKPVAPAAPVVAKPQPAMPAATPTEPAVDTENLRPALGFMPDYAGTDGGVLVGSLREGGPAEKAGLEAGDVIVALAGVKVTDVEHYTEVLDEQKIGKTVPVRIKRAGAEVELQITVGSRPRSR